MKNKMQTWRMMIFWGMFFFSGIVYAQKRIPDHITENKPDTSSLTNINLHPDTVFSCRDPLYHGFIHSLSTEVRPEYVIPTNRFLRGENSAWAPINNSFSTHLKYSFQSYPNTYVDRIYGGAYQGIGLAYYTFGNRNELGDPIALYLFQGARMARFTPQLSFNYEWNFGLSSGWKPYDYSYNYYNIIIGSKVNAYINANFYLNWALSPQLDLNSGITLTHFSNGNTKFPNAGLNTAGLKVGLAYNFNRKNDYRPRPLFQSSIPEFPRHVSYDLVLFGSWRRKGVAFGDKQVPAPNAYTVLGFNFAPMYNIGYKLRIGMSLDGVYDGSANVYTEDYIVGTSQEFFTPPINKQLALGISGRAEYVMPYFTVGIGIGANVIHGGGDLNAYYQVLALKTEITRNSFIHIGYSLQNFRDPNFLMLGIGFRFNNKYPTCHR